MRRMPSSTEPPAPSSPDMEAHERRSAGISRAHTPSEVDVSRQLGARDTVIILLIFWMLGAALVYLLLAVWPAVVHATSESARLPDRESHCSASCASRLTPRRLWLS